MAESGKPSVIIALNYDQFFNGKNHIELGVGFYYPVRTYLQSKKMLLIEAIEEILISSRASLYRQNCIELKKRYWKEEISLGGGSFAALSFISNSF